MRLLSLAITAGLLWFLADLRGELLGKQAAAPGVGRAGTGVDGRLQLTRQLVASAMMKLFSKREK